jgi:hypothetical protein
VSARREEANQVAFQRLVEADPVIVDIQRAGDVLPGMKPNMILVAGPPVRWDQYFSGSRRAILHGAVHEGLAANVEDAEAKLDRGEILVDSTDAHGVAATWHGIHTASMPVFVVEERTTGARGYCTPFEGDGPTRLAQGSYGPDSVERLRFVAEVLAPTLKEAIRRLGGIPVMPIIRRALQLGDEMHLRTDGATLLLTRVLAPALVEVARERRDEVQKCLEFIARADYTFVRIALAAAKATTISASGVEGSSLVTMMGQSCLGFGIKVSGLGDEWFTSNDMCTLEEGKLENPEALDAGEATSDCFIMECIGLGVFVGATALGLLTALGGSPEKFVERNASMYAITLGAHPHFKIPLGTYRGAPCGVDLFKVVETGIAPVFHGFLINSKWGVTVGVWRAPIEPFRRAAAAWEKRYGRA